MQNRCHTACHSRWKLSSSVTRKGGCNLSFTVRTEARGARKTPCPMWKGKEETRHLISHSALLQGGEPPPLLAEEIRLYTHSVTLPVVLRSRVKQKEWGAVRTASFDGSSTLRSGISAAVGRWQSGKDSPCPAEYPLSAEGGCFLPPAAGFVCASAAFPYDPL